MSFAWLLGYLGFQVDGQAHSSPELAVLAARLPNSLVIIPWGT